jgi:hypothetical protein
MSVNHGSRFGSIILPLRSKGGLRMKGETKKRWEQLCEEAAVERNSERLIQLVKELDRALDNKEARVMRQVEQAH